MHRRRGLAHNPHTIEAPLQPGEKYFSSVRARFVRGARAFTTTWGRLGAGGAGIPALTALSYRFRTPAAAP